MRSCSPERDMHFQPRRSRSSEEGRTPTDRRRSFSPHYAISPRRMSTNACNAGVSGKRTPTSMKDEALRGTSPAQGRRERRQKQSFREEEMGRREKDGKKPFYLMVDGQGVPYGPGRPAWVAEINKLVKWLDPSCTHIRK